MYFFTSSLIFIVDKYIFLYHNSFITMKWRVLMTIKEIAQLAGVSISTVSKIVNGKDDSINQKTRERVLEIVKEYNYTPYASVKLVSEAKTFVLGVLLNSFTRSSLFLNGAIAVAQKNGYGLLVYDSLGSLETELKNITTLCKSQVDGVIWEPVNYESKEHEQYFKKYKIEVCRINAPFDSSHYFIDFTQIGYEATKLLLSYGHTKVGCLIRRGSIRSKLALEGFKKCLLEHGIPFRDNMILPEENDEWQNQIFAHLLTGIISTHFTSAQLLVEDLEKKRLQMPYNLSLISLRDDLRGITQPSKISSIRIPNYEFGSFVCERLIEKCEKSQLHAENFQTAYPLENTHSLDVPYFSQTKQIVVVGSINIDVILNVTELPQPGQVASTNTSFTSPGGKGANQAVAVAKLGHQVSLIGKVGNDYDSALVYSIIEENHVNTLGILRDPQAETGKAYIHLQDNGESTITLLNGANETLSPEEILMHKDLFQNTSYCLIQTEIPENAVEAAAHLAHECGVKTILKPAVMKRLHPSIMKYTDIFVPNKTEADLLCPEETTIEGKAEAFIRHGAKSVIITLGHLGCYIKDPNFTGYLPAVHFSTIDTTGAADAFIGALAAYLTDGYPIEHAARIATYAAAFSVARQGVIPALIDRNSLEAYIKKVEPDIIQF
jgi:ribokinase